MWSRSVSALCCLLSLFAGCARGWDPCSMATFGPNSSECPEYAKWCIQTDAGSYLCMYPEAVSSAPLCLGNQPLGFQCAQASKCSSVGSQYEGLRCISLAF